MRYLYVLLLWGFTSLCHSADYYMIYDFTAKWCAPCQDMKKEVWVDKEIKQYLSNNKNIKFKEVDVDEQPEYVKSWHISSMPTIIIAKYNNNGKRWEFVAKNVGYIKSRPLLSFFKKHIIIPKKWNTEDFL